MAIPPNLKRLSAENFEEAEDWFKENFLPVFNSFLGDVTDALTNALTVADNFAAEEREVRVDTTAGTAADAAPFPLYVTPQKVARPRNVIVTGVKVETSPTAAPAAAVTPFWELDADGRVKIRWFSGLSSAAVYVIRVRMD